MLLLNRMLGHSQHLIGWTGTVGWQGIESVIPPFHRPNRAAGAPTRLLDQLYGKRMWNCRGFYTSSLESGG